MKILLEVDVLKRERSRFESGRTAGDVSLIGECFRFAATTREIGQVVAPWVRVEKLKS
jgi:hypothetical protein